MDQTNFDWINELESRAKSINKNELASWREKPATKSFTLSLSEKFDRPENFSMVHHKIHIEGWTTKGRIFDAFKEVHTEFIPSIVPTKEPISRKARPRGEDSQAWLIEIADRNGDNKLDENETTIWLNLQKQIITGQVFIGVYYKGGLFELLDTNHDGALSIRELKNGWQRLKETNTLADGKLDPNKLPQVLLCVISLGSAKSITIDPLKGPSWFQAMDRNRDGDVSRREFTGPKEIFDKIDTNKDDLIDAEEAEKYRPRK
jgi:Ca2+-binding EF-hand superfamily protein